MEMRTLVGSIGQAAPCAEIRARKRLNDAEPPLFCRFVRIIVDDLDHISRLVRKNGQLEPLRQSIVFDVTSFQPEIAVQLARHDSPKDSLAELRNFDSATTNPINSKGPIAIPGL